MTRWLRIPAPPVWTFFRDRPFDGATVLFAAILAAFGFSGEYMASWVSVAAILFALTASVARTDTVRFRALAATSVSLAIVVAANYFVIANHGFMAMWCALALLLACACPDGPARDAALQRNAAILLGLLMGFALIQKLRSEYYLQGDLLGGYLMNGDIYKNLLGWGFADWPAKLIEYKIAANDLMSHPEAASVAVVVPGYALWLAGRMTLGSLVAQAVLELALFARRRLGLFFHVLLIGFVGLVYSTRNENVFLSMNCLLGYCITDQNSRAARPFYALVILYLLVAAKVGVRPWIIG